MVKQTRFRSGKEITKFEHEDWPFNLSFSPEHNIIATCNAGGVTLWSRIDHSKIKEFKIGMTTDVKFNSSKTQLAIGTYTGSVMVLDLRK